MHGAILSLLTGDPDGTLDARLGEGFPAVEVNATNYLDGRTIHHGRAAARVTERPRVPVVTPDRIVYDTEEVTRRVGCEWYADLETSWAGVDTSAGEQLVEDYLLSSVGVKPEPTTLRLDAWADRFEDRDEGDVWGVSFSQSVEEGHDRDRAGAYYHTEADERVVPTRGKRALGFEYVWDGQWVRGMVAASGYATCYRDWTAAEFARWIADEIHPYLEIDTDDQATLNEEACADCGRDTELVADGGDRVCEVCLDRRDEERGESA